MKLAESLGKRIKRLRELKGLTQEQFEELSGINARYLSAIERGTKSVTIDVVDRIAKGLGVEPFSLFAFDSADQRPSKTNIKKMIDTIADEDLGKVAIVISVLSKP